MKFYIGVTDTEWYNFLAELQPDELNFWQPSGTYRFRAVQAGDIFLFKLKHPYNVVVGGGIFVRHAFLPLDLAWEAFKEKNGASSFKRFAEQIYGYRHKNGDFTINPEIGCIILAQPFFLPIEHWIPQPHNWSPNIVTGKSYDTTEQVGRAYWQKVEQALQLSTPTDAPEIWSVSEQKERYGSAHLAKVRLGQGAFRISVTEAYRRRCALTGEKTLPALDAAHIKPYGDEGPHQVNNGLLLRADIHRLFDAGYITITTDHHVEVSKEIRTRFENGRDYYALHGQKLVNLPHRKMERPSAEYIEWHNNNIFMP